MKALPLLGWQSLDVAMMNAALASMKACMLVPPAELTAITCLALASSGLLQLAVLRACD